MENNTNITERTSMFGDSPFKHKLLGITSFVTLRVQHTLDLISRHATNCTIYKF